MNKERLLRLAKKLQAIKPSRKRRFDLSQWYVENCETAACAIGEAGMIKAFNAEGFKLVVAKEAEGVKFLTPDFEGFRGWGAVMRFFDLEASDAGNLFDTIGYIDTSGYFDPPSSKDVAKRIREFVSKNEVQQS